MSDVWEPYNSETVTSQLWQVRKLGSSVTVTDITACLILPVHGFEENLLGLYDDSSGEVVKTSDL